MPAISVFDAGQLEGICKVLGETEGGLSGSEIGQLLRTSGIDDPQPTITKWRRLFEAFLHCQQSERCGNCVIKFIEAACMPARYAGRQAAFEARRDELNLILALCGYELGHDGSCGQPVELRRLPKPLNVLGGCVKSSRSERFIPTYSFCRAELLQDNYFHVVLRLQRVSPRRFGKKSGGNGGLLAQEALGLAKQGYPI